MDYKSLLQIVRNCNVYSLRVGFFKPVDLKEKATGGDNLINKFH